MDDISRRITDVEALKVFTHPLRIELLRALSTRPSATASQLAEQVDEAVSLVSYHLRKLAEHGFLVEAPAQSGDGRERWWKRAEDKTLTFRSSDFDDRPEGAAVAGEVTRRLLQAQTDQYARFLDQRGAWPREWSDAAFSSGHQARLTAAELGELGAELSALAQKWADRARAAEEAGETEGREQVALHLYGFPYQP